MTNIMDAVMLVEEPQEPALWSGGRFHNLHLLDILDETKWKVKLYTMGAFPSVLIDG
jgi:hypothetical protein